MKTILLGAAAACWLGSVACSTSTSRPSNANTTQERITVSVAKPQRRTVTDRLELVGSITPYEQVTVYAKASGFLKCIKVDIGDWVRKGDMLAELDIPEMATARDEKRAAVQKAEAALEQAQAAAEQSRADVEFQEVNYRRLKSIRDKDPDVLPEQEVDQARSSFRVAQARLKAAEAQIKVAEGAVATAKAELATWNALMEYARIVAPISGVITERFVDPGALIQAASASRTQAAPVVSIARLDQVRVLVDVPETKASLVRAGASARVRIPAGPGEPLPARVARTSGVLDPGSRTLRVEVHIPNPDHRLRPGMMAKVELELQRTDGALTVPASAVRVQGPNRAVFLVEGSKAKRRVIKTGLESPEWIQILDGLRGDEEVVIASSAPLTDGAEVRVNR